MIFDSLWVAVQFGLSCDFFNAKRFLVKIKVKLRDFLFKRFFKPSQLSQENFLSFAKLWYK